LSEQANGRVEITKIFKTKMQNGKIRNKNIVEEFLAMKNYV